MLLLALGLVPVATNMVSKETSSLSLCADGAVRSMSYVSRRRCFTTTRCLEAFVQQVLRYPLTCTFGERDHNRLRQHDHH